MEYQNLESFELYHSTGSYHPAAYGRRTELPAIGHAVSGSIGAAISNLLVFPLDVVVTRLQTQKLLEEKNEGHRSYESIYDAFQRIYKEEGVKAFYHGVYQDTANSMASTFFYHLAYNFIRTRALRMRSKDADSLKTLGIATELGIGAVAGLFSRFLTTPINNVVVRKQTASMFHKGSKKSSSEILECIYHDKGLQGLWSGYRATAVLTVNPAVTYYLFELFKSLLIPKSRRPTSWETFIIAAVSKAIASTLTYPVTLSKARMQAGSANKMAFSASTSLSGFLSQCMNTDVAELYEGVSGQILKGFFSQGILMLSKDKIGALMVTFYMLLRRTKGKTAADTVQNIMDENPVASRALQQGKKSSFQAYDNLSQAASQATEKIDQSANAAIRQAQDTANSLYVVANQKANEAYGKLKESGNGKD